MKILFSLLFVTLLYVTGNGRYTYLVKEMSDVTLPSNPKSFVTSGNYTFFAATTPDAGYELWRTDGTLSGTIQLTDIQPGVQSSVNYGTDYKPIIDLSGTLYFWDQTS